MVTSRACSSERDCSRDAIRSLSMVGNDAVSGGCFSRMSEVESSAGKYTECDESVLGVLGLRNATMVDLTGLDWSSGEILF